MPNVGVSTIEIERRSRLMETQTKKQKPSLAARIFQPPRQKFQTKQNQDNEPPAEQPTVQSANQPAVNEQFQRQQQQGRMAQLQQQVQEGGMMEKKKKEIQEEMRKEAKAALRNWLKGMFSGIGDAFGATLIGLIITVIVNLIVVVDWDLQMFSYYQKNQALRFFFPPLTWPAPFSNFFPNVALHVCLVTLNLVVIMLTIVGFCIILVIAFLPHIVLAMGATSVYKYFTDSSFQQMVNELIL